MKKILLSTALLLFFVKGKACADVYSDGGYFNLFTQSIIKDKTYIPFLLYYGSQFYSDGEKRTIPNENIYAWKKYFENKLDYQETEFLVNHMQMADLNSFKKNKKGNTILSKLGSYENFSEGIDYLIEAKYLEPFMRINYVESPDTFYYRENENFKNATLLDYSKTISALVSLYNAAKNPEIKQRYGYQMVRFNHYTRNYEMALEAFRKYVEPIKLRTVPYFYALDQMAGAQRGLQMHEEANWNFFQVFSHAPSKKEGAFVSMRITDSASFQNILKRASTPEEKNMAYFLLGYSDFNNPIPNMEKMYEIDPASEILKVMAARSINQLERSYLPVYIYQNTDNNDNDNDNNSHLQPKTENSETEAKAEKKDTFWDKIVNFFKSIFGDTKKNNKGKNAGTNDDLLNNPHRLPVYDKETSFGFSDENKNYIDDLSKFIEKTKTKSDDEFWQIADAYIKFLQKDYKSSNAILAGIQTSNPEYTEQISRMKILNDIVSQPKIDAGFENHIIKNYLALFSEAKKDSVDPDWYYPTPSTADFIRDILANRYFLQGEDGKSFLMSNLLSHLQYYPDSELAKKVEEFINRSHKTDLEKTIIMKNVDMENPTAFFNIIYGDNEIRNGNFENAKKFYSKSVNFKGIPRFEWIYSDNQEIKKAIQYNEDYDGFHNIPSLVFGFSIWESFQSSDSESMDEETFVSQFGFIKEKMNKLELAEAMTELKKINTANSNQLIGNVLYNTSSLGYYRELLMMDINNSGWAKNDIFRNDPPKFKYYYKNYSDYPSVKPDNFDVAIGFYNSALKQSKNPEQQARILFQMASAEQGKYYQWETKQQQIPYDDKNWEEKQKQRELNFAQTKNQKFRTYFSILKKDFSETQTSQRLMGSCSYYNYFMKKL